MAIDLVQLKAQYPDATAEELLVILAEKANAPRTEGGLKVGPKGGISLYGMGRFPVTLYANQWEELFSRREEILGFITAKRAAGLLKEKPESK